MTAHLPLLSSAVVDNDIAPPPAPLHMPKQSLTAEPGILRRALSRLAAALPTGRRTQG